MSLRKKSDQPDCVFDDWDDELENPRLDDGRFNEINHKDIQLMEHYAALPKVQAQWTTLTSDLLQEIDTYFMFFKERDMNGVGAAKANILTLLYSESLFRRRFWEMKRLRIFRKKEQLAKQRAQAGKSGAAQKRSNTEEKVNQHQISVFEVYSNAVKRNS